MEAQAQQIIALREDCLKSRGETAKLQHKLTGAEVFLTKSIQLEIDLKEAKRNEDEAIRLAEIAKNDFVKAQESSIQWKKRASELDTENKRYKDMLERNVESVSQIRTYSYVELLTILFLGSLTKRKAKETPETGHRIDRQVSRQREGDVVRYHTGGISRCVLLVKSHQIRVMMAIFPLMNIP